MNSKNNVKCWDLGGKEVGKVGICIRTRTFHTTEYFITALKVNVSYFFIVKKVILSKTIGCVIIRHRKELYIFIPLIIYKSLESIKKIY